MTATEPRRWRDWVLTLAIGAAGAALFGAVGFPVAFLTGPAFAVTLAAMAGLRVAVAVPLRDLCFLLLGLNIGAGVTPEVLATAARWPLSLALLALLLVASLLAAAALLERVFGFDRASAVLAATPGHLSYVLSYAADRDLELGRIALVQSIRVLLLTLAVPVLLTAWGGDPALSPAPEAAMPLWLLLCLGLLGFALGRVFRRLRVPAALLLAGMAVSAVGHATELTPGAPPAWLVQGAFLVMGAVIGTRFSGVSLAALRAMTGAGLAVTALASALALGGAGVLSAAASLDPQLLFVAYAPGGVEAMAAMAVQLGLAPAVVAAHHVLRLLILSVLVPALMPRRAPRGP